MAILRGEDDAAVDASAIASAHVRRLSAASYLEGGIVLDSQHDPIVSRGLDDLLQEAEFVIEPVTERQARLARQAYTDFGKGSGHSAGLNFGATACRTRWRRTFASRFCGRATTLGIRP